MPEGRPRLYLIDGYSNIFRAYHAIRGLSNSKGLPTNAVYGFIQMLRKLLREERPELVGIALDVGEKTVRSERFEAYKANRAPMPEDLVPQIPWVRRAIEAFRIPILELANYEADDVLATLARRAAREGYDVVLVSADKDLAQLVDERVSLLHTGRNKRYDPASVAEDFGVPPQKVADVLALQGDAIDNVPGVPGIGEKGARQLIQSFGSLEALLERAAEVERKSYREGLLTHRDQALLSKELVTLHGDLPVELDPDALRHEPPDPDALRRLFAELEFFSLLEELAATPALAGESLTAVEQTDPGAWTAAAAGLADEVFVAAVGREAPLGLAAGGPEGQVLFADFRRAGMREAAVVSLAAWAADTGRVLVGHDLKETLRLAGRGARPAARLLDTMLVAYLLRPALRGTGLAEVALDRVDQKALSPKDAGWDKGQEPVPGSEPLLAYAAEQVELVRRLAPGMRSELGSGALAAVYREIEEPLLPVLLDMEEMGIALDVEYLRGMSRELEVELAALEGEIYTLAGERFNINSPQQLGAILFDRLGYPVLRKTRKTRSYATGAEVLQELAQRGYPLPERMLRYRELAKLKSTYVDALPALVGADGRLHTRFNQAGAATGRLSSAKPNLQNIPVRTGMGQRIRRAFVAGEGRLLVVADYSQIELRVLAHIAGERALIAAFEAGEDIHRSTAAAVFGVSPPLVTTEQRRAAKVINFGILYGMSAFGLAQNLQIGTGEADAFIKAYLDRYPAVRRYIDETLGAAERDGKVETLYGRVRWLPDIRNRNRALRENARRMAINARIQGTAADLLKKAMIAVDERLRTAHPQTHLLLTVHDELVLEAPAGEAEAVAALVREEMAGVERLRVPLVVDTGCGPSWFDAKP